MTSVIMEAKEETWRGPDFQKGLERKRIRFRVSLQIGRYDGGQPKTPTHGFHETSTKYFACLWSGSQPSMGEKLDWEK
jgi:hypothetical protein